MARLPYLDADQLAPEQRELLKRPINLTRLLVNSPGMARAFGGIGNYIRHKSTLDPRLRELQQLCHPSCPMAPPYLPRQARDLRKYRRSI